MKKKKYLIALEESEVKTLKKILRSGKATAQQATRIYILLMADENGQNKTDKEIQETLEVSNLTPRNVRKRFDEGGIEKAVYEREKSGRPKKITAKEEALVVAKACTEPPEGAGRWTLSLLQEKAGVSIGRTSIYRIMLKNDLKPWREKNVVHSRA